jgi:hypothetical protein
MTTLVDFLLARIAEDEAVAREPWLHVLADVKAWWDAAEDEPGFYAEDQPDDVKGLAKTLLQIERARGMYARVLAECEAKRRIVALHAPDDEGFHICHDSLADDSDCGELRALAAIYADHPDYREEWKP